MVKHGMLLLAVVLGGTSLAACGGGGGDDGPRQTSYIIGPQACGSNNFTSVTIYIAEKTDYCTYLKSNTSNNCPPTKGEKTIEMWVGQSSSSGPVASIGPGTYTTSGLLNVIGMIGDGTTTCPSAMGTGSVTLTRVSETGGVEGTYDVEIDGVAYRGDIKAPMCWAGDVPCT